MLRCLDGSPTNPYVQVSIALSSSTADTNFCPVVFYFARDCLGGKSIIHAKYVTAALACKT